MPRPLAALLLLFCTILWGFAFVAQKSAMDEMGALTFAASRYLLGGFIVLPLAVWEYRRRRATGYSLSRRQWLLIGALGVNFFLGSWLQQVGLAFTTATNGGFLTALYVMFVPVIAFLAMRTRPHPIIYVGIPLALTGIFYLNGGRLDVFNFGDILMVGSALFWGMHVFLLGLLARETGLPIFISAISFLGAGVLCLVFALVIEAPTVQAIGNGWPQILYTGVLSTAVAFTLQAIGQQYVPAANAAIILSAEALFAALGAAIILGERLPLIGYAGAGLIFAAILLVEAVPALNARRAAAAMR
jgi:drug/metabolite transporter (DMT)-like permease